MGLDVDLTGELIDRRFRVEHWIGSGGMGSVWAVRHVESLQHFALKTLRPALAVDSEAVARFLREARAAAALRTRHVVRIIDTQTRYRHANVPLPFMVMELLEGRSLQQLLDQRERLDPGELVWVLRQVGKALAVAHASGIVHRDLKPANVFLAVDEEGEPIVKLCDFGVAKLLGDAAIRLAQTNENMTETGAVFGTPLYMAPEQLRSASRVVPATDGWALGMIAFRALSGREYFSRAASPTELVLKIAQDDMPVPSRLDPTLPPAFDRWFARVCHRDPARRFSSVEPLVHELETALRSPTARAVHPTRSAPAAPRREPARSESSHLLSVIAATVLAVVGIVVVRFTAMGSLEEALRPPLVKTGAALPSAPAIAGLATVADAPVVVPVSPASLASGSLEQQAPQASALRPTLAAAPPGVTPAPKPASPSTRSAAGAPSLRATAPAAPATSPLPTRPAPLESGQPCTRSAQCASGLCVAEACR